MPFKKKFHNIVLSNINQMELHNKIKFFRLSKNLTQAYLADELQIDVANYSRLERGETSISIERLEKIAQLLEVNLNELLTKEYEEAIDELSLEKYLKDILQELKSINQKINMN
jgi:transcriptional regulator with XRE-family HTH domain